MAESIGRYAGRLPANEPCHPHLNSPRDNVDWTRFVPRAISDASGGTRTTVLQAHTHQWVGMFSGTNGDYRDKLQQAKSAISA
ncbi:MAG TPA: hypothetical protein VL485_03190 [Ktedonobacteraceae bacterium]|nr:hypothetical protein [Ktedonobacteraceae bacterium]